MTTRVAPRLVQHPVMTQPGLRQIKAVGRWCRERAATATSDRRALPDLVLVGVQRSGTTALFDALYRLPNVERPRRGKGSHYFSYNYVKGWDWFQSQFPTMSWAQRVERKTGNRLFCFDACPYYLFHPFAIERMALAMPKVKVLVMLRDPVRRAESHFHHSVGHGHEDLDFAAALDREDERLSGEEERMAADWDYWSHDHEHHSYVAKGLYAEQLNRLFTYYPRDQVLVRSAEEFYDRPDKVLTEVTEWCGLPPVRLDPRDDRNGHRYQPMDEEIRHGLIERFRQPNDELFELLGRRYDWLS